MAKLQSGGFLPQLEASKLSALSTLNICMRNNFAILGIEESLDGLEENENEDDDG